MGMTSYQRRSLVCSVPAPNAGNVQVPGYATASRHGAAANGTPSLFSLLAYRNQTGAYDLKLYEADKTTIYALPGSYVVSFKISRASVSLLTIATSGPTANGSSLSVTDPGGGSTPATAVLTLSEADMQSLAADIYDAEMIVTIGGVDYSAGRGILSLLNG